MLISQEVILAKIESTYNSDPTPTGSADAVLVGSVEDSLEGARMHDRPAVRTILSPLRKVFGGTLRQVTFSVELKGSGTAGTAPEYDPLLRACGLNPTTVASTSVTYAPVSSSYESCTIYYNQDGRLKVLTGCRGTVAFTIGTDEIPKMEFTMTGHSSAPTDVTIPTPTYDSTVPEPFIGASFAIDSFSAVIASLSFEMGNTIATPPSANASDGYGDVQITGRDITGSFDPEDELVATEDWEGNWRSGASMALATGVIGATAGNQWAVSMPAVYYTELSGGERDGVRTKEMTFASEAISSDNDLSLAFT